MVLRRREKGKGVIIDRRQLTTLPFFRPALFLTPGIRDRSVVYTDRDTDNRRHGGHTARSSNDQLRRLSVWPVFSLGDGHQFYCADETRHGVLTMAHPVPTVRSIHRSANRRNHDPGTWRKSHLPRSHVSNSLKSPVSVLARDACRLYCRRNEVCGHVCFVVSVRLPRLFFGLLGDLFGWGHRCSSDAPAHNLVHQNERFVRGVLATGSE